MDTKQAGINSWPCLRFSYPEQLLMQSESITKYVLALGMVYLILSLGISGWSTTKIGMSMFTPDIDEILMDVFDVFIKNECFSSRTAAHCFCEGGDYDKKSEYCFQEVVTKVKYRYHIFWMKLWHVGELVCLLRCVIVKATFQGAFGLEKPRQYGSKRQVPWV